MIAYGLHVARNSAEGVPVRSVRPGEEIRIGGSLQVSGTAPQAVLIRIVQMRPSGKELTVNSGTADVLSVSGKHYSFSRTMKGPKLPGPYVVRVHSVREGIIDEATFSVERDRSDE